MLKKSELLIEAAKKENVLDMIYDAIHNGTYSFGHEEKMCKILLPLPSGQKVVAVCEESDAEGRYLYRINEKVAEEIKKSYFQILFAIWYPVTCFHKLDRTMEVWIDMLQKMQEGRLDSAIREDMAEAIIQELKSVGIISFSDLTELEGEYNEKEA